MIASHPNLGENGHYGDLENFKEEVNKLVLLHEIDRQAGATGQIDNA